MKIFIFLFLIASKTFAGGPDLTYSTSCNSSNNQAIISFVGDVLIHRALYETVVDETQHFSQIWKRAEPLFQKADFSVGNLEGLAAMGIDSGGKDHGDIGFVYDNFVYSGTNFSFNYHPRILNDLKNSGFDLMTNANNHVMDRTYVGIDRTIQASEAVGLPLVGTHSSKKANGAFYKIASIKNIRVAFLGCTEMTNGKSDSKNQVLKCYNNPDKILSIIKELKERSDIDAIVVYPHWGSEYTHTPDSSQRSFSRKYIDAGAIAVVGSHPHVLQPWEKYVASDGREGLILYSLGNFVAGQAGVPRRTGPVAYLGLSKNGNSKAKIFGVGYTPTFRTNAVINPIGSDGPSEVLNHVAKMFGTKARIEPNGSLLPVMCSKR